MKIYTIKRIDSSGEYDVEHFRYNFREIEDPESFNIHDSNVSVDLDPCPFCGINGTINWGSAKGYYGWCSICDTEGPSHYKWYFAARMWNARNDIRTIVECKAPGKDNYDDFRKMDFDRFTDETKKFMTEKCFGENDDKEN